MAAAICNFFQTRLLCHQDAEILSFHQDTPATNRIGPPSGSNVTIFSCFGRCYGGLQTESRLKFICLAQPHVEPLDCSFQPIEKHVSMVIRDFQALWSPPKCHVMIFVVIHDMSLKSFKNFQCPVIALKKQRKRQVFRLRWDPGNPQKPVGFRASMSKMLQVRAMSGEVLWGPQEPGGLPWVAMGCWRGGVKTRVIWGASWIGHIMFYTYRNLSYAPKTTALPFIWMLNEGEHSTRDKNMISCGFSFLDPKSIVSPLYP